MKRYDLAEQQEKWSGKNVSAIFFRPVSPKSRLLGNNRLSRHNVKGVRNAILSLNGLFKVNQEMAFSRF